MSTNAQYLRLRHPKPEQSFSAPKPNKRHDGILQDQLRRAARGPWCPSFSLAFRLILLARAFAAIYANISDCDEVFNFWEPLHYFDKNYGFQTWEVTPQYAIRSWAYIVLHLTPVKLAGFLLGSSKRQSFFALRMSLALVSSLCEAKLYRAVVDKINYRVGRYMLFTLIFSAGMWNASIAFLPSSFAMYMNSLAFAYALDAPSASSQRRTLMSTVLFAVGAIVGWPFSLAIAIPFVLEELFIRGADIIAPGEWYAWWFSRIKRLIASGQIAALIFLPVVGFDSLAYGKLAITPWNIVKYNIFGGSDRGPDLFGAEPWFFYLLNLLLNFNIMLPLALSSLPSLILTYFVDRKRLGGQLKPSAGQSSPYTVLAIRLAPFYVWLGILTLQSHKEERFMFPVYTILAFNAAVTMYLIRGWLEAVFVKITSSPYRASKSLLFRRTTLAISVLSIVISISRIMALITYYHAPLTVIHHFETKELPWLLNTTGLLKPPKYVTAGNEETDTYDLSPVRDLNLTLCFGKEWYRFPSHYLVPDGVSVAFIKSDFDGLLPRHFDGSVGNESIIWPREATRLIPSGMNDLNKEEAGQYIRVDECQYLIDLDIPTYSMESKQEVRYAVDSDNWTRVFCWPFLDASRSSRLTRAFWAPVPAWNESNNYGDYCLLRSKRLQDALGF